MVLIKNKLYWTVFAACNWTINYDNAEQMEEISKELVREMMYAIEYLHDRDMFGIELKVRLLMG
jgi:hypothetical protein